MGLSSWFSTTASKSSTAALIQMVFEPLAKGGILDSQPAALANRVVEAAYTRIPRLANANYNKHVFAVSILGMVPALPSFSVNERESCKHALGMLLKHVFELQMSNSLALTLSEQGLLDRAQQAFLETMEPSPGFKLGPSFEEASPIGLDLEKFSRVAERKAILIDAESSIECIALERDYIDKTHGSGAWTLLTQSLVDADGRVYDKFDISLSDGTAKTVWFDITFSWEKWHVSFPANQEYRCSKCGSTVSNERAQAKLCAKCDNQAQPKDLLNTTTRGTVELPSFTPTVGNSNLDTAKSKPSTAKPFALPLLVIVGTVAMLATILTINGTTSPIPEIGVSAEKTVGHASPQLATLSDVLREMGHSWDETSNTGKIKYLTLPKEKELANLKQYLGQPLLLRVIHTAKLADPTQEILFFSSTPIPKDSKSLFDCHACYPLLSAMIVTQTLDRGLIATVPLQPLMFAGSWGTIAMDGKHAPTLVKFGPKVSGFTLQHSYGNQGENRSWITLHSIKGNRFHSIGEFDSEVDSLGSYSCDTRRTREACKASVTVSTFHESASSEGYYDLLTSTNTTYIDNGVEEHTTSKEHMRFNGKRYASVEAAIESRVPKSNPSSALVSSGGSEPASAPAPEAAPKATATRRVLPIVDEFAVRQAEFGAPAKPYDYTRLETEHWERKIQHESKPSFLAEFGARLSGNTSVRTPPQSSDGTNVVVASTLPSENSKTPEEKIAVLVKRRLKDTAPLNRPGI